MYLCTLTTCSLTRSNVHLDQKEQLTCRAAGPPLSSPSAPCQVATASPAIPSPHSIPLSIHETQFHHLCLASNFLMRHDFTIFVQHHNWLLIKLVCSRTYKQNCKRNKECNKRIIKFATSSSTPRAVITTVANSSVAYFTCSLLCSSHHPPWPPPISSSIT